MTLARSSQEQTRRRGFGRAGVARASAPLAAANDVVTPSPALALQARLSAALEPPAPPRWSRGRTLLFVVGACGGFWLAVAAAVAAFG